VLFAKHDQVKENEIDIACSTHVEDENAYRVLMGKSKGMRPLGRPRCRWENNIKKNLKELGWGGMD
jgi:hypothetical protein